MNKSRGKVYDETLLTVENHVLTFLLESNHHVFGAWTGQSAGGQISHPTFVNNPQYLLKVPGRSLIIA